MSEEEGTSPTRRRRKNPLDIDYSLKIGTSVYHVLGKRRGQRRGELDYYVMDDTLIRSNPKGTSRRPRYIVDEPRPKKKIPPPPPTPKLNIKDIRQALAEIMEEERQKIVAAIAKENDSVAKANEERHRSMVDSIEKEMKETPIAIQNLKKKLVGIIEQEFEKISSQSENLRDDLKKARGDERKQLTELLNEQKVEFLAEILQQQKAATESINSIKSEVTGALRKQQGQQTQVDNNIKAVNEKLEEISKQIANQYANIRIANDLDAEIDGSQSKTDQTPRD